MREIYVDEIFANGKMTKYVISIFLATFFAAACNGFTLKMYGVLVGNMMGDMGISPATAGMIGSVTFYGMFLGSITLGALSTKFGSKNCAMFAMCLTIISSVVMATTDSITVLIMFRALTGFGVAGFLPCNFSYVGEYMPVRYRPILISLSASGVPVGTIISSLVGVNFLAQVGWRGMFMMQTVLILPLILYFFYNPPSITYCMKKGWQDRLVKVTAKAHPEMYTPQEGDVMVATPVNTVKATLSMLFKNGLARNTILYWITYFFIMLYDYGLATWLPSILVAMNYNLTTGLLMLMVNSVGAIIGQFTISSICAKRRFFRIPLICAFAVSGGCLIPLMFSPPVAIVTILIFIAGLTNQGIVGTMNAYCTTNYPLPLRPMSIGSSLGFSRFGGSFGSMLGGWLLASAVASEMNFLVFACCAFAGLIFVSLIKDRTREFSAEAQ